MSNSKSCRYGRRPNRKRGQAVVEFALVIPIFMLVLSGMMDFGMALFQRMTIINSAREGARAAVMVQLPAPAGYIVQTAQGAAVSTAVQAGVGITTSNVVVTCIATSVSPTSTTPVSCDSAVAGDSVKVKVDYAYTPFFPLLSSTSFPLGATVQMVID